MSGIPTQSDEFSRLKRALLAIEKLQNRIQVLERKTSEPIAVVGLGCRLPGGANSPEAFWQSLRSGSDMMTEIPGDRWDVDAFYDPDPTAPGKMNTRHGGFVDNVELFDAQFFGIAPREAVGLDPQQRFLLEVSWEALEHAGIAPDTLAGSQTGVFIGINTNDYMQLQQVVSQDGSHIDAYSGTGNTASIAAGRLSYTLGLQGPSIAVDTACSSSLVTIHMACQSLRSGECDLALAGGVLLVLTPIGNIMLSKLRALAPDGRCKTFDARADGYGRGEGCGVAVLKRLSDAQRDGDRVLAVIRGSAVNQDGRSGGITAPNGLAQEAVIRQALLSAGVAPAEVGYIEAHGTGTSLGDPIEVRALGAVLGEGRPADRPFVLGSVKTNIGHLEAAAGIAGFIKAVLTVHHGEIPPHLHLEQRNPHIDWERTPALIPTALTPWPEHHSRRIAGVSSFGFSGTNAHLVIEAAPPAEAAPAPQPLPAALLPLSARSPESLRALARSYQRFLLDQAASGGATLEDICHTAGVRRAHHSSRLALVGASPAELAEKLAAFLDGAPAQGVAQGRREPGRQHELVFVFSGQGAQWVGMGRDLFEHEPVFRAAIEQCAEALGAYVDWPLIQQLTASEQESRLEEIDVLQPLLFALQVGLAALLRSWGVEPDAVVGHSLGEIAAAHVAGALSLDDAARVIAYRSLLLRRIRGQGGMIVAEYSPEQAGELLRAYADRVSLAVNNSARSIVLSGDREALAEIAASFDAQRVFWRWMKSDVAGHSPQIDPLCDDLLDLLQPIQPRPAAVPFFSTVTATELDGERLDRAYWARNLREPVLFSDTLQELIRHKYNAFIELSPHPLLTGAIEAGAQAANAAALTLGSLRRDEHGRAGLLASAGALYAAGYPLDWGRLSPAGGPSVDLPSYPWQHERFWITDLVAGDGQARPIGAPRRGVSADHPLLGEQFSPATDPGTWCWELDLALEQFAYLRDHQVQGVVVLPAAAYVEMALEAAALLHTRPHALRQIAFKRMLVLRADQPARVQLVVTPHQSDSLLFQVFSRDTDASGGGTVWTLHASGLIALAAEVEQAAADLAPVQARCADQIAAADYYQAMHGWGLHYGPCFQGIRTVRRRDGESLSELRLPDQAARGVSAYRIHPALLDACFQTLAAATPLDAGEAGTYLPVAIDELRLFERPGADTVWSHATVEAPDGSGATLGHLRLLDAAGRPLLLISGMRSQILDAAPAQGGGIDEWLYRLAWKPLPLEPQPELPPAGVWCIFADRGGLGQELQRALQSAGHTAVLVRPDSGGEAASGARLVDFRRPAALRELFEAAAPDPARFRGIIHLWGLDTCAGEDATAEELAAGQDLCCTSLLHIIQGLLQGGPDTMPRLYVVTRGAQPVVPADREIQLAQSTLWGLGRTVAQEHPELRCTRIDLAGAPAPDEAGLLLAELGAAGFEDQLALRPEGRFAARLGRWSPQQDQTPEPRRPAGERPFRLETGTPGMLDGLTWRAAERRAPGPDEVEIEVRAAGVNFIDVLKVMGIYPGQEPGAPVLALGGECAGVVARVGPRVRGIAAGDTVVAVAPGAISTHVTVPASLVCPKPARLSWEAAATIPSFMTAFYALHHLARLQPGERVLIHSAAGGTGLAAVQLAQRAGAVVFATAGSAEKRAFLQSIGVQHVMDSRSLAFADQIMEHTGGAGVDVVLNSLTGQALVQSLAVLGPYGRFLEIGKKDIYQNSQLGLYPFHKNLSYFAIDIAALAVERHSVFVSILRDLVQAFAEDRLAPPPVRAFAPAEAVDAFHLMAQAQHIGKLVIAFDHTADLPIAPASGPAGLSAEATYLISGGLGGLGLTVARWMVEQGARHLVLMGRRAPSPAAAESLEQLRAAGAEVVVAQGDVAAPPDVAAAITRVRAGMPPLRGVVHIAGVLDDSILLQLTPERFGTVMAPKLAGSWNLHRLTQDEPLDFFIGFSSAASMLGAPGQGNYAAANAFLDGLAHYRRQRGLPALSINWGPWGEVGLVAGAGDGRPNITLQGVSSIPTADGLEALRRLMLQNSPQVGVIPLTVDWSQIDSNIAIPPLFRDLAQQQRDSQSPAAQEHTARSAILAAPPEQQWPLLEEHLRGQIAQVLRLAPSKVDAAAPLSALGFDSLMSLELRNRLELGLGLSLPATLVWAYPTLEALTPFLAEKIGLAPPDQAAADDNALSEGEGHQLAEALTLLKDLSAEDLLNMLADTGIATED